MEVDTQALWLLRGREGQDISQVTGVADCDVERRSTTRINERDATAVLQHVFPVMDVQQGLERVIEIVAFVALAADAQVE